MKMTSFLRKAGVVKSAILATSLLFCYSSVKADGSREMYPSGNKGYRAAIWSSNDCKNTTNPFPTVGVMKVYAKAGEHILLGSSAIGKGEGAIGFRAPNGATETYTTKEKGRIDTRAQELAGPNYNGSVSEGFTPIDVAVESDQEGVWEIYFMSPTYSDTYNSDESTSKYSIENWRQNNNDGSIMAFDISVSDAEKTKLIPGRVYTNVLNVNVLQSPNDNKYASSWYSNLYILTNVGYTYRVNTNGQNPHYGAFFSNNKGLQREGTGKVSETVYVDPFSGKETGYKSYQDGEKSYKSLMSSLGETGYIYDPRLQDNRVKVATIEGDSAWKYEDVTHKIFFCQPAEDLPASAKAVYGTTITDTWLKTPAVTSPKMEQLSLQGKEARLDGVAGPEGMQISFDAGVAGSYTIKMAFSDGYADKILSGSCINGVNTIDWDGTDGEGVKVALEKGITVSLSGELTTAEVHFPFTDLENNENGFILELIDKNGTSYSDVIYWDDSDIQSVEDGTDGIQSLNGTSSATGAHKWTTENSSGNDAIIDSWSYVKVKAEAVSVIPSVHFVDLAVTDVKSVAQTVKANSEVSIQMQVENLAKSDVAYNDGTLNLNDNVEGAAVGLWVNEGGFHVTEIIINESDDENCKVLQQPNGDENAMGYISLQNGKKATITVKGYADESLAGKSVQPQAYIMRPGDVFEIDAENLANDGMPNNPIKEYAKENNNVVACQTITVDGGVNQKPVVSNTDTETLDVTIKGANGTSYAEDPIMLPINIFDPEKSAVTTTLSGDDAANFKVENGNIYYVGTTPASGDNVVYAITVTAKDDQEGTTVRNVNVTLLMEDASLKPCDIAVKCDTIKYGQTIETAIAKMTTADTTATGEANGTWMIRSNDQSEVNTSDVPDAGVYELTFSYYTDLNSDYECETVTKEVVVLPRTVTLTSGSAEKEYDGTAVSNESIEVSGDGFYGSENVVAKDFASLQNVGEKENDFEISYTNGAKESNYNIEKKAGILKVTPKQLYVTDVEVADKKYDGNTDGEVTNKGTLNGVIEGDKVEIESAIATFSSDEMGTDSAIVSFTLIGEDASNYIVKDTTVKASILANDTTPADADWTITNPTLAYGDATVGGTEKAEYKNPAEDATVSYELDGVPAKEGDLIPAGNHTIKVVYTDPTTETSVDTTFTCEVSKRPLTVEGSKSEPKVYDGNTDATLAEVGTLNGVLAGDEVTIDEENTTATFDTPAVGTGKDVNIAYELAGKDADNYEVDSKSATINDGVITAADADWTITNPTLAYGEATVGGTEKAEYKNPAEDATISYELDGVPAKEGDKIPAGNHTIKVVYTDPTTETSVDTTFTCEVTKRPLTVEGAKSEPKVYDGNTDATLADVGTLNGVLAGDEVTIDEVKTTATFDTPAVGTGKDVNIAYELAGKDADNYEVDSKSATINDGVITAADADWTITNPTLAYGEATVGGTDKAEIKNPAENATIAYELDGVPAKEGDLIPAGNHTIKVVYTDPTTGFTAETTFDCAVSKKPLAVEGATSTPKEYDGNTNATLSNNGTLVGVEKGDDVVIAKAQPVFETPSVGTGKNVAITYTLGGKDLENYEFVGNPVVINDGVITKVRQTAPIVYDAVTPGVEGGKIAGLTDEMEISTDGVNWKAVTDADATFPADDYWVRYAETEYADPSSPAKVTVKSGWMNMVDAESFLVDVNGYCPESEGDVMFRVIAGNPSEFRATIEGISDKEIESEYYRKLDEEGKFTVYIPMCDAGAYTIKVQFRNSEGCVSPVYRFEINVNLSKKYIYNLWDDVVSIINKNTPELDSKDFEKRFVAFQWYRNDEEIEGATMPYYNEKGGLNGVYYASVVTADDRRLRTCSQEWHFVYGLTVNVYPNPVVDMAQVTLSQDNGEEHHIVVTNMMGVDLFQGTFSGDQTTVNLSSFPNGWYVVSVDNSQVKIIKE